jgi:hypothetical protein
MKADREETVRARRSPDGGRATRRRPADAPTRSHGNGRERRSRRSSPQTTPIAKPTRAKSTSQAKARAKARKAKAPKVVRPPLRARLIARLSAIDLNPRTLAAKVPFVVFVIGSLGVGLGLTLWLSTNSAERSYELSNARETNRALQQQKEALERNVLEAQAAPALAEAARNLGMIPSRDTAHLVQDAAGNWVVVGTPKPAEGVSPPPMNTKLPEEKPTPPPVPVDPREVVVHLPSPSATPVAGVPVPVPSVAGPEVMVRTPAPSAPAPLPLDQHAVAPGAVLPGPGAAEAPSAPPSVEAQSPAAVALSVPADVPQPVNAPTQPASGEQSVNVSPPNPGPAA